jgi:hypothetical protein
MNLGDDRAEDRRQPVAEAALGDYHDIEQRLNHLPDPE